MSNTFITRIYERSNAGMRCEVHIDKIESENSDMSVPVGERGENKLQILSDAKALCVLALRLVSDKSSIPKSQRWHLAKRIVDLSQDIYLGCVEANDIFIANNEGEETAATKRRMRFEKLTEAKSKLVSLAVALDLAMEVYGVESKLFVQMVGYCSKCKKEISGLIRYDKTLK